MFDLLRDPIACCDRDGAVVYANAAMCERSGQPPELLVGATIEHLFPGDGTNHAREVLEHAVATDTSRTLRHFDDPRGTWWAYELLLAEGVVWIIGRTGAADGPL